jgi:outer membrane cobalamin receptor
VIIDQETIKKSRVSNLNTLLQTQANISVAGTSTSPGQIYLRGGDSANILVLVDGLPFYDASTINKNTNLNQLDIKSIRRIEIIKGSQSVLYGGQALSGVIRIETFPKEIKKQSVASLEAGNRQFARVGAGAVLPLDDNQAIVGQAQAARKDNGSVVFGSSQAYPTQTNGGSLGYLYSEHFDFFAKASHTFERNDIATVNTANKAADTQDLHSDNAISGFSSGLKLKNTWGKPSLVSGYQQFVRKFMQATSVPANDTDQHYQSTVFANRFELSPVSTEKIHWLVGLSHTNESFFYRGFGVENPVASTQHQGVFSKLSYSFDEETEFEAGVRAEQTSLRDRVDTYQIGLTFLKNFKLEHSTGFRVPSLFQLYAPANTYGGNSSLKIEKARSWNLSYDYSSETGTAYSVALFQTNFDDLVTYVGTPFAGGGYRNLARTETKGIEAGLSTGVTDSLRLDATLGYQEPRDVVNATWLARRPLRSGSARLTQSFEKESVSLEYVSTGSRRDGSVMLASYSVWNASYNRQFADNFTGFIRANNFMNSKYETALGYYDEGSFWFAGLEIAQD